MSHNVKIVAIIQARTGSSRLPNKVLREIKGRPMIEHQIERVKQARWVDEIVLATTTNPGDLPLVSIGLQSGIRTFVGSEEDVLDRIYKAAKEYHADVVVRLTADCPLVDAIHMDRFIRYFLDHSDEFDYVGNGPTYPEGLDIEVFSFSALERAWREAKKSYEREHATVYICLSGFFRVARLEFEQDLSRMRWTVDEENDFQLVLKIYEELLPRYGYRFGVKEILQLFEEKPEIAKINRGIMRNEGFLKSLSEERGKLIKLEKRSLIESEKYWAKAKRVIPAGTQTLSKSPTQFVEGVAPKYLARGKGSHVWDVDGNEYIDYPMALGAIILGHAYPSINKAIEDQLKEGITFSLMHPLEIEVSELLRELIPCSEMVRFGKNGSDATTGAIRLARAYTGREKIAHCGYHGWHDWYIGSTTRNRGVPRYAIEQQFGFRYNDLESLKDIFFRNRQEIAAVIMEPFGLSLPKEGFLDSVKNLAHENGALLIYDEVATGFRFYLGGVHQYFGVEPDLACFGKAMANGMPISALVGRAEIMQLLDEVFYSFTFGGECLSLAATKATLIELKEKEVIPYLWGIGRRLQDGFNRLISDFGLQQVMECVGLPPRTFVIFREVGKTPALLVKSLFQQEVIKRGVLFTGAHCLCFSHTVEDIEMTLGVYQEALEILKRAIQEGNIDKKVEGRPVQPVFRPIS